MKKNLNEKIINFSQKFIIVLFFIIIISIGVSAILLTAKFKNIYFYQYQEDIYFALDNVFVNIILTLLIVAILYVILKFISKIDTRIAILILLMLTAIIGFWWVNYLKVPVRADSKKVFSIALDFLKGDYSSLILPNYIGMHPMQLGIVYFLEFFYWIFKNASPLAFQNFNVILVLICEFLIYQISKNIYENKNVQIITLVVSTMFIAMPFCSVLVYGNIVGLTLALLGILLLLKYLKSKSWLYVVLIPIVMAFSIILKANFEIVLIAISIILLLDVIKKFNYKSIIIIVFAIVLVKISNPLLYSITELQSGMHVSDGTPMISYIAMGMYKQVDRAPGWYNKEFNVESVYEDNGFDTGKTKQASMQVIKDRLDYFKNNLNEFIDYYAKKIGSTWLEPAFQTIWTSSPMEATDADIENYYWSHILIPSMLTGKISTVLIKYLDVLEIVIYLANLYYVVWMIKNKSLKSENLILILAFIGGFMFHILWETKSIYALPFFVLLIPSASFGLNTFFEAIEQKIKLRRKNI